MARFDPSRFLDSTDELEEIGRFLVIPEERDVGQPGDWPVIPQIGGWMSRAQRKPVRLA